ncbi:FUSC family protein [Mucilaginibacter segetis]|uniref:FUSC family protein n=1 Tax=Mucilaginibacter segetis TaxID=2793071 RepID=A0A934PVX7_9SPHI|nr:FUSC family membrane protein [Mucilaginibacter segetis]MBK0381044.1 FUSC family protein [Mucilaginibacter segetis]
MTINLKEIKSFFYSQYFSDGLRMTIGILLPTLIMAELGYFERGITISLGALCIGIVDGPGPILYKRNAMAVGNVCIFVVALVTGFARLNIYTLGSEIFLFSFLFSMLAVYGNRAASIGTSALLIMILMMDKEASPSQVPVISLIILSGGLWYMAFSLLFFRIRPYRAAQQTLAENIADISRFLRIRAAFYLPETNLDDNYRKLVSQQIQVSNHQDAVREILFKSRLMVKESTPASRILVLTFIDLVDMFEQIMATHYDYVHIREKFKDSGVLQEIAALLNHIADELDNIGYGILANTRPEKLDSLTTRLENLKLKIDDTGIDHKEAGNLVLMKIFINLRDMSSIVSNIYKYYHSKASVNLVDNNANVEYSRFVPQQDYAPHIFFDNLSFSSGTFKHALRVALVCIAGFITAKSISLGHHSYWVLLTIIVILKPGFSLSKQRNYQRLIGTICGGVIGILILTFVPDKTAQFIILLVLMMGTYSFIRLNYIVSVIFMTPYILILFKFLGVGLLNVAQERIIDTIIGSSIAFAASYLLFPTWEFQKINESLRSVISANINYLMKISDSVSGKIVELTEYKLARKDVYVNSANLSATFERMTSEPKSKQHNIKDIHKFVVLNHILSSYTANIASALIKAGPQQPNTDTRKLIKKSIAVLKEIENKFKGEDAGSNDTTEYKKGENSMPEIKNPNITADDMLLNEQLGFINKITLDIAKVTDDILK